MNEKGIRREIVLKELNTYTTETLEKLIKFKHQWENRSGRVKDYRIDGPTIARLFNDGMTANELAKMFNCSYPTIKNRLKEQGISIKNNK